MQTMKAIRTLLPFLPFAAAIAAVSVGCTSTEGSIDLVTEESYTLDAGSSTVTIEFSTETPWEASVAYFGDEEGWIYLDKDSGGAGSSSIDVTVAENTSGDVRKAAVTIADEEGSLVSVSIEQTSEPGDPDEPEPPVSNEGFVKDLRIEYSDSGPMTYSFDYNGTGRLSGIEISFEGEDLPEKYDIYWESYPAVQVRYAYDGTSIFIYDENGDGIAERIEAETEQPGYIDFTADLEYDGSGHITNVIGSEYYSVDYLWDGDGLVETRNNDDTLQYTYSAYENNANLDLNWIMSDGYYSEFVFFAGLMDMLGTRSAFYVNPSYGVDLSDENRPHEPITEDGEYTFTTTSTIRVSEEAETEYDYDTRLNSVTVTVPVYEIQTEYRVERTILDYEDFYVGENGDRYYNNYSEKVLSKTEIGREKISEEYTKFIVEYY